MLSSVALLRGMAARRADSARSDNLPRSVKYVMRMFDGRVADCFANPRYVVRPTAQIQFAPPPLYISKTGAGYCATRASAVINLIPSAVACAMRMRSNGSL